MTLYTVSTGGIVQAADVNQSVNWLKTYAYNVKDYGAVGDGSTDDTTAIANARSAANSAGGGTVVYPFATYISGNQTLYSNVVDDLRGSTIKLKAGANTDLFSAQTSSINLATAPNTSILGTLSKFSIRNGILDGNKANQTAGPSYPIRFYGYDFLLRDLEIVNGYTGGVLIDWNYASSMGEPSNEMESTLDSIKIHNCGGIGLQMGGPHDSRLSDVVIWDCTSHGFHFAPNAQGMLCSNIHPYLLSQGVTAIGCLDEASGCSFVNCMFEGSDAVQFAALAGDISIQGGMIFGNTGYDGAGLQMGQVAGGTPIPGQIKQSAGAKTAAVAGGLNINTKFLNCATGGAINPVNEANNTIYAHIYQISGTGIVGGALSPSDTYNIHVVGLTGDGTVGKGGGMNVFSNGSTDAFRIYDATNTQVFLVDNFGNMYVSGGFNTSTGVYFNASNTPNSLSTGGTINALALPNIAVAPTADVTGIIMQAGYAGQITIVQNASDFTVTFAASGTSHVANGVSCKISPNSACLFHYNGTASLWEPTGYTLLPSQSATAVALAASGTIAATDLDVSRVAPTGNVASIILTAGTYPGQKITVVNESASTVTMAASGTSHVADGVSCVIPALRKMDFTWDSGTSLWYH